MQYFFRIFTHLSRNDPFIRRLTEADEEGEDNERPNGIFEPLNQEGELDESFNPLTPRELSILTVEKADKNLVEADEVCSICCDNFEEK